MPKQVKVIAATKTLNHEDLESFNSRKKRVAAYARVSTDELDQQSSYENQIDYYTRMITSNPDWEFAGVHADEGVSGTSTKHRKEFARLMDQALSGNIDIIYTKSISRFARNTLDSIKWVRQLQSKNVEVRFEKEGINTLEPGSELRLTIFSSIAQEESESISTNIRWALDKRRRRGDFTLPYSNFLGYRKGADGRPEIVEEEAAVIRKIYHLYMDGYSCGNIAKQLTAEGIKSPGGKDQWHHGTVRSILQNEKYKGEARLHKTYSLNVIDKKVLKNHGEVSEVYVKDSHPAIIDPGYFDLVQQEFARRTKSKGKSNQKDLFACKLVCAECGCHYGHRTWNDKCDKRYSVWVCSQKYDKDHRDTICQSANVRDEVVKQGFIESFNLILQRKADHLIVLDAKIARMIEAYENEDYPQLIETTKANFAARSQELAEFSFSTSDYPAQLAYKQSLIDEAERLKNRLSKLKKAQIEQNGTIACFKKYRDLLLNSPDSITSFERDTWRNAIKEVIVSKADITYCFWDDNKITLHLNELISHTAL